MAAHAGTGEAWVGVTLGPGTLDLTVRDAGAGFDPARVDPARLGLCRSITERVADWGGRVSVQVGAGPGDAGQHELARGRPRPPRRTWSRRIRHGEPRRARSGT